MPNLIKLFKMSFTQVCNISRLTKKIYPIKGYIYNFKSIRNKKVYLKNNKKINKKDFIIKLKEFSPIQKIYKLIK